MHKRKTVTYKLKSTSAEENLIVQLLAPQQGNTLFKEQRLRPNDLNLHANGQMAIHLDVLI